MACRSTRTCQNRQPRLSIGGRSATRTTAVTTTTPKRPGGAGQAHTTRDGRALEAQVPTAVPRSCVSRRSPAAACRLARTDRYTLEGPNHHANRVDGRGWASGAYFGALAVVMVVGGICECSLRSNWSVAKAGFCNFFCNNFCNFKAVCNPPHCVRKASHPKKSWGADKVRNFLRSLYVGISTATWVAKVAQLLLVARYGESTSDYYVLVGIPTT